MAKTFTCNTAAADAIGDHFHVLHTVYGWGPPVVQTTVQQVIDYFSSVGKLVPWGKIIAILAPAVIKLISGQPVDWAPIIDALLALIPIPTPPAPSPMPSPIP